jgi:MOSC domain-containing protein YiiM
MQRLELVNSSNEESKNAKYDAISGVPQPAFAVCYSRCMKLVSVNVGTESTVQVGSRAVQTGIHKHAVSHRVMVTRDGLDGDRVVDEKNHGGPDQAVFVFTTDDYDRWVGLLGEALSPGTFGENLTVSGFSSATLNIGDRLAVGAEVILEVTAPRIPCGVLASRMGDTGFVKRYRQVERPGAYCRVIRAGTVGAGDLVGLMPTDKPTISLLDNFRLHYDQSAAESLIRRALEAPIAIRTRQDLLERLEKLEKPEPER